MWNLGANVEFPKFRGRCAFALENDSIVMANGHSGGSESTWQPASQSWPMDKSGCVASWGTIGHWCAVTGRPGRSRSASWVECMITPDGVWMAIGSAVGHFLQTGVVVEKNVPCNQNWQWHRKEWQEDQQLEHNVVD